jgi:hypothetical protein
MINYFLDRLAYSLLSGFSGYTPELHYDVRQKLIAKGYGNSSFCRPYWFCMVRSHLADFYWRVRDVLVKQ